MGEYRRILKIYLNLFIAFQRSPYYDSFISYLGILDFSKPRVKKLLWEFIVWYAFIFFLVICPSIKVIKVMNDLACSWRIKLFLEYYLVYENWHKNIIVQFCTMRFLLNLKSIDFIEIYLHRPWLISLCINVFFLSYVLNKR